MPRLLVALNENGMPVLYRALGVPPPTFPAMGLLSALYSASVRAGLPIRSARSHGAVIAFKRFNDALLLSLVASDDSLASEESAIALLDIMFAGMVMVAGLKDVNNCIEVERLRRLLRTGGDFLDTLLDEVGPFSLCPGALECRVAEDASRLTLTGALCDLAEECEASYAALLIDGAVAAATPDFWQLSSLEASLLVGLVASLGPATSRDLAVYLPETSPDVPERLLTVALLPRAELLVLCGPEPSLDALATGIVPARFKGEALLGLRAAAALPRPVPAGAAFDPGVLAFLYHDPGRGRQLACVSPSGSAAAAAGALGFDPAEGFFQQHQHQQQQQPGNHGAGLSVHGGAHSQPPPMGSPAMQRPGDRPRMFPAGKTLPAARRRFLLGWFYRRASGLLDGTVADRPVQCDAAGPAGEVHWKSLDASFVAVAVGARRLYAILAPEVPQYAFTGLALETAAELDKLDCFGIV